MLNFEVKSSYFKTCELQNSQFLVRYSTFFELGIFNNDPSFSELA